MEELLLEMFEFIVIAKIAEAEPSVPAVLEALYSKSKELMMKLNPLVVMCDLEKEMKERGQRVRQ